MLPESVPSAASSLLPRPRPSLQYTYDTRPLAGDILSTEVALSIGGTFLIGVLAVNRVQAFRER